MEQRQIPGKGNVYATLQMTWIFLVISVVIYLFVARFVTRGGGYGEQGPTTTIAAALVILSAILLGGQLYFRTFLSDERLFPRIREEMVPGVADRRRDVLALLQNHVTFNTILWAMGEAPAIFGLVLTLLSGDMRYVFGFALYSLANLFLLRPRRAAFEEQLTRLRRYLGE